MAQKLVAEMMIETLVAAGVKRIYGVVGDSLNGLLEEIRKCKEIECQTVQQNRAMSYRLRKRGGFFVSAAAG